MANMILDPIMEKLISAGFHYLKDQVTWQKRTKEELEKLEENHIKIQAVVRFASSQEQITEEYPDLNKWLWQLRDAIDDADDVLDDLEYTEPEEQLTKNKKLRRLLLKIFNRTIKIDKNLENLESVVQKLNRLLTNGVDAFFCLAQQAKTELLNLQLKLQRACEAGYLPKNDLIGRRNDKEYVMQWLSTPSNEHRTTKYRNISLLSIKGHGGMGKTTLLQHVYVDEITKIFDLKMWVCVSNNFDVKKVISDMLECLKKERPHFETTLGTLQGRLGEEVMSKKFLLVLDDIWEEEEVLDQSKWENVLSPLAYGRFGSKILVTTRTESVALMFAKVIQKKEIFKLDGLEEDECLELLSSHAFAGVENPKNHENLRVIARDIVKKLSSSPLAAKAIGGILNSFDLDEGCWRTVLESNLFGQNSIKSILRRSYTVLSNPLKSCFAFCSIFPQDHKFDKDDLIRMWIALGFIQPPLDQVETNQTMEDVGGRYFDVLVKKSFFDKFCTYEGNENFSYYKMHDLLLKLAQSVFVQECLRVEDSAKLSSKTPKTLRHLSVQTTNLNILRKIEKFKHLHSLFLFYEDSNQDLCSTLIKIFKASRCLRLLYIRTDKLEMIPEEIGYLKHLRYLKIERVDVTRLPRSLSNLHHLQYIIYDPRVTSNQVDFLPSDINKLSNLRYLKLFGDYISSIHGIGKLNSLQELDMFDLRNEMGYRIDELKCLNDLCKLGINCLENVNDAEEACNAQLCEKRRLTDLTLCWSWSNTDPRDINLDDEVLDKLVPPNCLRNLRIKGYMGARSAIWMNNVNLISNLQIIKLEECSEWETLPPFGLLPSLKFLKLGKMPKVKWLESKFKRSGKYRAFPLLEVLHISKFEALEDWFEAGVAAEDGCLFPRLIELVLFDCPKLKELPSLPPKLKSLNIGMMGWKTLNSCSNSNHIPLETLEVFCCPNITYLEIARLAPQRDCTIRNFAI